MDIKKFMTVGLIAAAMLQVGAADVWEKPRIVSTKMRTSGKTIMDVVFIVEQTKATANVRTLAFQGGERSFFKVGVEIK